MLVFLILSQCTTYINAEIGVHHLSTMIEPESTLCLNITYYPFYLAFHNIGRETVYNEYYSRSGFSSKNRSATIVGEESPSFRMFSTPYGSVEFSSPKEAEVSFTYAALPGICETGVFFFNEQSVTKRISHSFDGTDGVSSYDDKCLVFAGKGNQSYSVDFYPTGADDQLFIYSSYENYTSINERFSGAFTSSSDLSPLLFRLVTSQDPSNTDLTVTMTSDGQPPLIPSNGTVSSIHRSQSCQELGTWYSDEFVYTLIVISAVSIVVMCILAYLSRSP